MKKLRHFTPYEQTQLARAGMSAYTTSSDNTMPIEYITGVVDFCGMRIETSSNTLIPRIETEELVFHAADYINTLQKIPFLCLADVGCGTGAIGIGVARAVTQPSLSVHFFDISAQALEITKKNIEKHFPTNHQAFMHQGDLLSPVQDIAFDVICANLPYIPTIELSQLPDSVINYEPRIALDGGVNGTEILHRLIIQASEYIKPNGILLLEIHHHHTIDQVIPESQKNQWIATLLVDQFHRNRFLRLKAIATDQK